MASPLRKRNWNCEAMLRTFSSKHYLDSDICRTTTPKRGPSPGLCSPANAFSGKCSPTFAPKRHSKATSKLSEKHFALEIKHSDLEDAGNRSFGSQQSRGSIKQRKWQEHASPLPEISTGVVSVTNKAGERGKCGPGRRGDSPEGKDNKENLMVERSRKILEGLMDGDGRLNDVLQAVQEGYECYITSLESSVSSLTSELKSVQFQLSAKLSHFKQLEILVEALQAKNQDFRLQLSSHDKEPSQIAAFKKKIRLLVRILNCMKEKGFPVQETYKEVKSQSTRGSEEMTDTVGNSDLSNSFTDDPELSGQACLFPIEKQLSAPLKDPSIPKIHIPKERAPDFQSEFFSKFDEFSESWRLQITKTQNKLFGELLK